MKGPGTFANRLRWVTPGCLLLVGCLADPGDPQVPDCLEHATFGDPRDSAYVLPYPVGHAYEVYQTYCGPVSHGEDGQMAIDFLMPLGSEVTAAREGIVRRAVDDYDDYGGDFNFVYVEHDDGTSAFYGHLQRRSLRVHPGERVARGQVIASSGASGTHLPHLHFGVASRWPVHRPDNVPVNFSNARGPLDERGGLRRGVLYRAVAWQAEADRANQPR